MPPPAGMAGGADRSSKGSPGMRRPNPLSGRTAYPRSTRWEGARTVSGNPPHENGTTALLTTRPILQILHLVPRNRPIRRWAAALLNLLFLIAWGEPVSLHPCPTHDGVAVAAAVS